MSAKREFLFGKIDLPDPDQEWSPERVLEHYAKQYPSLKRGSIKLIEETDHGHIFELKRSEFKPNG